MCQNWRFFFPGRRDLDSGGAGADGRCGGVAGLLHADDACGDELLLLHLHGDGVAALVVLGMTLGVVVCAETRFGEGIICCLKLWRGPRGGGGLL